MTFDTYSDERIIAELYVMSRYNSELLREGFKFTDASKNLITNLIINRMTDAVLEYIFEKAATEDSAKFLQGALRGRETKKKYGSEADLNDLTLHIEGIDYMKGFAWGFDNAGRWEGDTIPDEIVHEIFDNVRSEKEEQKLRQIVGFSVRSIFMKFTPLGTIDRIFKIVNETIQDYGMTESFLSKKTFAIIAVAALEIADEALVPGILLSFGIPAPSLSIFKVGLTEVFAEKIFKFLKVDPNSEDAKAILKRVLDTELIDPSELPETPELTIDDLGVDEYEEAFFYRPGTRPEGVTPMPIPYHARMKMRKNLPRSAASPEELEDIYTSQLSREQRLELLKRRAKSKIEEALKRNKRVDRLYIRNVIKETMVEIYVRKNV